MEEENLEKENVEKKKELEDTRKRKREEKEKEKEERKQEREAKKVKKMEEITKKKEEQKSCQCKAECGATYRTGPNWIGCESCEIFWVCPRCWKV